MKRTGIGVALIFLSLAGPAGAQQPGAGSLSLPAEADLAADAEREPVTPPPPSGEAATRLDEAVAAFEALPLEDYSLKALAARFGGDPVKAFEFVRDRIALDAYAGALRDADGTLAARAGNAFDRALLLQNLLTGMGVKARLAFAELDDAALARVLERVLAGHPVAAASADNAVLSSAAVTGVETRARRDYARLRAALGSALDAAASTGMSEALAESRRHVWVQAEIDGAWLDLDPTLADATPGTPLAPAAATADAPADSDWVAVTLNVEIETLSPAGLATVTALTHRFPIAAAAPAQTFLYLAPPAAMGSAIAGTVGGTEALVPMLMIDGEIESGESVALAAGGPSAIGALGGEEETTELVAVRLRFVSEAPGVEPATATRVILDRLTDEARARGPSATDLQALPENAAGLMARSVHQILLGNGGTNLREHLVRRAIALDQALQPPPEDPASVRFGFTIWPLAEIGRSIGAAHELLAIRDIDTADGVRAFVARPQITTISFSVAGERVATDVDLTANPLRLIARDGLAPGEAARRRLWHGAVATALESEFVLRMFSGWQQSDFAGASFAMDKPLALFGPAAPPPGGAPAALRAAVASGLLVALPGEASGAEAWWTIDPASGVTRSILAPGLGGARGTAVPGPADGMNGQSGFAGHETLGAGRGFGMGGPSIPGGGRPGQGSVHDLSKQWEQMNRPAGAKPQTQCRAASEETAVLSCVSVPGSVGLGTIVGAGVTAVSVVVLIVLGYFIAQ